MLGFRQVLSALRLFAFAWIAIAALCTLSGFSDAEAKDFRILRLINGINRPDLACCTPFYIFHTPVIEGDRVAFMSRNGGPDGVWSANIKTRALTKLVGLGTPVPGGTGNLAFYIDSDKRLTIGGGRVAFFAADSAGIWGSSSFPSTAAPSPGSPRRRSLRPTARSSSASAMRLSTASTSGSGLNVSPSIRRLPSDRCGNRPGDRYGHRRSTGRADNVRPGGGLFQCLRPAGHAQR